MRQKFGNILWGIAFIVAGVGVAGNVFNLWNFNLFFNGWWTLFIIIPCLISIIQYGFNTGNSIGLAIGALLLLSAQDILPAHMAAKMFFPVLLVIVGLAIIFRPSYRKANFKGDYQYKSTGSDGEPKVEYSSAGGADTRSNASYARCDTQNWNTSCGTDIVAVFCGNNGSFTGREFKGASATAVFGGVDVDLRGATFTGDVTLNATAIFGGVEVFTDNNIQVVYRSVPIFGGVDCNVPARDKSLPTVYVNCVAIFGGIDIN